MNDVQPSPGWEAKIAEDRRTCDPRNIELIDAGYEGVKPGWWRAPGQADGAALLTDDEAKRHHADEWNRIQEAAQAAPVTRIRRRNV